MFDEDDLLPISALQHLLFCERQCALIHIDQLWQENLRTATGRQLHERVHEAGNESRGDVRIARGVALRSLRLGLVGKADVVEFHRASADNTTASLSGVDGAWRPFPVEYKRGKPKCNRCDEVQLCAQAFCLEEMMSVGVPSGALFYGTTKRRLEVPFDAELRALTEVACRRLRELLISRVIPPPRSGKHCRECSLVDICLPKAAQVRSAVEYLSRALREESR